MELSQFVKKKSCSHKKSELCVHTIEYFFVNLHAKNH